LAPIESKVDEEKLTPKNVGEVRSFHGLPSFNRRFVRDFSTLANPNFGEPFVISVHAAFNDYFRNDGFLFKGKGLCMPMN
ncbi:hypothetical protein CR513_04943, partial [Mucuna pruriens]